MKTKWAAFNRFEFKMPIDAINDCSHSGSCDADVEYWQSRINLSHIPDEALRAELKEYGAWDSEELKDREANERRIIWIAASNIQDGQ